MYKVGMYGGTFDPVHTGHVNNIVIASTMCEKVYVILCYSRNSDKIDYKLRYKWLKEITNDMPNIEVKMVNSENKNKKEYDWEKGRDDIIKEIGTNIDIVFAGSDYEGTGTFEKLYPNSKIKYIDRNIIPVSSTDIRNNPLKYYEYIPELVRSYYNKKVIVVGTESCGKSTLIKNLSKIYNTNYLEEVGRALCEEDGGIDNMTDNTYLRILLTHKIKESEMIKESNKVLFVDTDALVTLYYYLLGNKNPNKNIVSIAESLININKYDLWLFLEPDVKWVQDGTRTFGEENVRLKNNIMIKEILKKYGINYKTIKGNYYERLNKSIKHINKIMEV